MINAFMSIHITKSDRYFLRLVQSNDGCSEWLAAEHLAIDIEFVEEGTKSTTPH
jgi:hypothetical protein